MTALNSADSQYSLSPLGAGDLIDRAVRFYRNNFWTFVLIASPPVVAGTLISVGWTMMGRDVFSIGTGRFSGENVFYYVFLWFGSILIWFAETMATLAVMGGASRNFVRHLLFGEPITFRETYKNTWARLTGLIAASSLVTILVGTMGTGISYLGVLVGVLLIVLIVYVVSFLPLLAFIISVAAGLAIAFGTLWLFFLATSRLAYVPQVMLVEGLGVFRAIGRSASLAGGNVTRLMALFIFTIVAAYSALALLYLPLVWYAAAYGVELMMFDGGIVPAWYEIASNLIWQVSFILLSPVWMVGLCLLYVDERVRREGYDIELMAARRLGDIPVVPDLYINPLQPALSNVMPPPSRTRPERATITTLGLK